MSNDYIPGAEEAFNDWQENWVTRILASTTWGLTPADMAAVTAAQTSYTSAYAVGNKQANPNSSQRQAKRTETTTFKAFIRNFVNTKLNNNAAVTPADRNALGLTVYDTERTPSTPPAFAPKVSVDSVFHLGHKLRITNPNTPESQAKPDDSVGMRVYIFIGTVAPADISQYAFHGIVTRFLYTVAFNAADIGKTAWYIVQYQGMRGLKGPQSTAVSAMII
jgi:hypothetical protein